MNQTEPRGEDVLRDVAAAEGHITRICFKTGPPRLHGVELEWTVHDATDATRPVGAERLRTALGPHCPTTLDPHSPRLSLPGSGAVTVEPGGQLEISSAPRPSLTALHQRTTEDIERLTELLDAAGLRLGDSGTDPHRAPHPVVETPRYRAMRRFFDRGGPDGRTMMYSTAGLQICLDAGRPEHLAARWSAVHELGPPLLATFATATRLAGRRTGHASTRMVAWQRIDPGRTAPVWAPRASAVAPATAWSAYALAAPLLCVRDDGDWTAPPGVTFRDWIDGALSRPPTRADLDYHLTTLFPPIRPRGYLEIRYLDAQPGGDWIAPVAVVAALFADETALDLARQACEPVADRWSTAAHRGLGDPAIAAAARAVLDAALRALDRTDLPPPTRDRICQVVERRLAAEEGQS